MAEQDKPETQNPQDEVDPKNEDNPVEDPGDDDDDPVEKALRDDVTEGDTNKTAEQLRTELRKSDRVRKRESAKKDKELADLRAELKKRAEADKSEQEKALEKAREEGRESALSEARKERRGDRLALAVERLAAKGVKFGDDGDPVKFQSKAAMVLLEKQLERGELDVFDDSDRVRDEALREAVTELFEEDDWLIVRPESNSERPRATESDAGKGGSGAKTVEEMSPEEHYQQIRGKR